MQYVEDLVGQGVERVLRWAYPGILIIGLFWLSGRDGLIRGLDDQFGIWGPIFFGLGTGFATYLFQGYVVHPLTRDIWAWRRSERLVIWVKRRFQPEISVRQARYTDGDKLSNYLDFSWAAVHACAIIAWLPLVFAIWNKNSSWFDQAGYWLWLLVIPSVLFVYASLRFAIVLSLLGDELIDRMGTQRKP